MNVGGATVTVTLAGAAEYKGLLLLAEVDGRPAGAWGAELPEGVQHHPHCKQGVTHDTYHVGGKQRDDIPWVVPDGLADGARVVFRATIVREYSTWCAPRGHTRAARAAHGELMRSCRGRAGLRSSAPSWLAQTTAPAARPRW